MPEQTTGVDHEAAALREWLQTGEASCPSCGYLLSGLDVNVCPECGKRLRITATTGGERVVVSARLILLVYAASHVLSIFSWVVPIRGYARLANLGTIVRSTPTVLLTLAWLPIGLVLALWCLLAMRRTVVEGPTEPLRKRVVLVCKLLLLVSPAITLIWLIVQWFV